VGQWRSALVKLDDVAVRIAYEDPAGPGTKLDRSAAQPHASGLQPRLGRYEIGTEQGDVRDSRELVRRVHQNVRLFGPRRIEDEIELDPRGVIEDRDWLGPDRSRRLGEAEQGVKTQGAIEVVNPDAHVGEAGDRYRRAHTRSLQQYLRSAAATAVACRSGLTGLPHRRARPRGWWVRRFRGWRVEFGGKA